MNPRTLMVLSLLSLPGAVTAQSFPTPDPVLRQIWALGMDSSQVYPLAQTLMDSIGPRLTGSPGIMAGNNWLLSRYRAWGIPARNETYGTWKGWRRGITHVDLISPRVRTLEATMLAWSPGTPRGQRVAGPVVILPDAADSLAFRRWLPQAKDKYVMISYAEPTCRPDSATRGFVRAETFDSLIAQRTAARQAWGERISRTGYTTRTLPVALEDAGARGILTSNWSGGYGVTRIFNARTQRVPTLDLGCEDYGLVYRLAENSQSPVIQVEAQSESLGEIPVFNTIAEIRGSEKPDEYVVLSAHFDSWDGSSGATDNGTGTVTMLEAMRILKRVYPNPRRTILVGHWSGEEQGLNGSRAFMADHQEIVNGLQALFNQDNGTGRVSFMSAAGLVDAGGFLADWMSRIPSEITGDIRFSFPGAPAGGGSDNASVACYGAPGFGLGSAFFDYFNYTWHTNRDTFDKVVFDDLRSNATLTAMLAYLASEDPRQVPRDRRIMPITRQGGPGEWPACQPAARSSGESTR
ncbi:MAG: M20/M25/M40 family metallo-hydrolase [Gemmatimonadales bacterium]